MPHSENKKIPYFWPSWFFALLTGRLTFGDSFWAGMFGSLLLFVPAGFVLILGVSIVAPNLVDATMIGMVTFYAIYLTLLTQIIIFKGLKNRTPGPWRWVGMAYAVAQTLVQYALLISLAKGAGGA